MKKRRSSKIQDFEAGAAAQPGDGGGAADAGIDAAGLADAADLADVAGMRDVPELPDMEDAPELPDMLAPVEADRSQFDLSGFDVVAADSVGEYLGDSAEYGKLPCAEEFNAYPPEVQRKIMEWTDRDVKARRDDESRRQDELMRATVERERRKQMFPTIITVLALVCGAVTGIVTGNPLFTVAFLLVPLAVIAARVVGDDDPGPKGRRNKPPRV